VVPILPRGKAGIAQNQVRLGTAEYGKNSINQEEYVSDGVEPGDYLEGSPGVMLE